MRPEERSASPARWTLPVAASSPRSSGSGSVGLRRIEPTRAGRPSQRALVNSNDERPMPRSRWWGLCRAWRSRISGPAPDPSVLTAMTIHGDDTWRRYLASWGRGRTSGGAPDGPGKGRRAQRRAGVPGPRTTLPGGDAAQRRRPEGPGRRQDGPGDPRGQPRRPPDGAAGRPRRAPLLRPHRPGLGLLTELLPEPGAPRGGLPPRPAPRPGQ